MRRASYIIGVVAVVALGAIPNDAQTQEQRGGTGGERLSRPAGPGALPRDRWQPKALPRLPQGMTLDMIRAGDSVYHGKGGCVTCHGPDGYGMPNSGSGITMGLGHIPAQWQPIDSLVTAGIPEALTRSSVAMPARGATSNLTPEETRAVAAYVWALTQVADEPWPGGHRTHAAAATTTAGAATTDSAAAAGTANPRP